MTAPSEFQRGAEAMRRAVLDAWRLHDFGSFQGPMWAQLALREKVIALSLTSLEAEAREAGDG